MSFYITLPSDNSLNYFPDNKISHFITRLPTPIELTGNWECALAELIFPHSWHNVNRENNLIGFDLGDGKEIGRNIPPGCYENVPDILKAISIPDHENRISFNYNSATKRVRVKVKNNARVIFHEGLSQMLGFPPMIIGGDGDKSAELTVFSPQIADPNAHFRVLMIYTDIIEHQIVGDVYAPLLRAVTVSGSDGEMVCVEYQRPHYLPVSRKILETIEINIKSNFGFYIPFERGRSYVKLHFRQKYLS